MEDRFNIRTSISCPHHILESIKQNIGTRKSLPAIARTVLRPYQNVYQNVRVIHIKMSELRDVNLAGEGLPRKLSSDQKKVILHRMLYGFDATSTYDDTSYVFRMSFEKVIKI
jgi:hypothetical protein